MEMVFKFRESTFGGDAQVVGETFHRIRARKSRLTPADVVEEAAPEKSPLHRFFEWDDSKAAREYRLEQSRYLISAVVVVEAGDQGEIKPIRAFVNVNTPEGRSYEQISVVMGDPGMRQQVIREVKREIARLREKLSAMDGFSDLLAALTEVEGMVAMRLQQGQELAGASPV